MPTKEVEWKNDAVTENVAKGAWSTPSGHRYRLHVRLMKDDADSVSAVVLNLPGAGSCGATEEEALENAKEAVRGVLEEYIASGQDIPWKDSTAMSVPPGVKQKWITLDA